MSSASSSRCALRRAAPPFPLIPCPDCGRVVKQCRSGTPENPGWVYYKCMHHGFGCNFWNWELEYIGYLLEHNYLRGDAAMDALGWAEDRREELQLRKEEQNLTNVPGQELKQNMMIEELKEVLVLLKIVVAMLFVIFAMMAVITLKK